MLADKIKRIILIDTYIMRFDFIDGKFMKILCKRLKIQSQCMKKLKPTE